MSAGGVDRGGDGYGSDRPDDGRVIADGGEDRAVADERDAGDVAVPTLRQRIRENPRPAAIWAAGALVLLALEFSRIVAGAIAFGEAGAFAVSLVFGIPGWIGANVGDALGRIAGAVAHDVTGLAVLAVVAAALMVVLPVRIVDRLPADVDLGRTAARRVELALLTAVLAVVAVVLAFTPVGGFVDREVGLWVSILHAISELPSLTSPEVIPNVGHRLPDGGWSGTFLGLSPRGAWFVRFALVWVYAFACVAWAWRGYIVYRDHYREADWTPRDDVVRRFRNHTWGLFGLAVVLGFVVLAAFAPAISPVPYEHNVGQPFNNHFEYLNDEGEVVEVLHGTANVHSRSNGQNTVGIDSYDDYDRYAPLGTTPNGQDMLTHIAFGARTSLVIALTAVTIGGLIAIVLSLMTAFYKGLLDIVVVFTSDTIISVPVLVMAMMVVVVFQASNHPLAQPMDGGLLLSIVLGIAYWPGMWRSIRGPSLQVAEQEWVDAAKSYGQTPGAIMKKHMAPYILSYIIIYASLLIGGVIITVAALSFLGLGVAPPTPEWGRLINDGRGFIWSSSWHIATITGLLIATVVVAFNALGDAIRDSIDPEADVGEEAAAGGGGG